MLIGSGFDMNNSIYNSFSRQTLCRDFDIYGCFDADVDFSFLDARQGIQFSLVLFGEIIWSEVEMSRFRDVHI
jgi:hypothetical protein